MGALTYEPDQSIVKTSSHFLQLTHLAEESHAVLNGASEKVIEELLALNGSSAGAHPKILVGVSKNKREIIHGVDDIKSDYEHWIVKFTSSTDLKDNGAIEYAYSLMARAGGINMPETYLFQAENGGGYFGVKRFDRRGNDRMHVHSLSGLLHADHRLPSLDYEEILRATLILTKSMPEAQNFFRLAAFNVFTHNRDDHAKNFAYLMDRDGTWRTAPAYDLTFSSGPGGEHSTTVMGEGRNPNRKHLQRLGKKMNIKKTDEIIDQVADAVSRWQEFAEQAGVTKESRDLIRKNLNFRLS